MGYNASEAKSVRGRTRFVVLLRAINVGNRKAPMAALREACRDAVCTLYRPHGSFAAGAIAIAAGVYEFTPLKPVFRRRCCENVRSGFEFGLYCVGSCIGLMLMQVALGVMSVTWMSVIAVLIVAQKLLPARAAIDVALAIVGLGILIVIAPSSAPELTPRCEMSSVALAQTPADRSTTLPIAVAVLARFSGLARAVHRLHLVPLPAARAHVFQSKFGPIQGRDK